MVAVKQGHAVVAVPWDASLDLDGRRVWVLHEVPNTTVVVVHGTRERVGMAIARLVLHHTLDVSFYTENVERVVAFTQA
jgi:hypothetical protein